MKQFLLLVCMLLFSISMTIGQRTVSGKVTDSSGEVIIGANIFVKESPGVGTITDVEGKYSLNVPTNGTTLLISYTGYETQEVAIGGTSTIDVSMTEGKLLDEVVVTALGISRDKKSLGYSTQRVGAEEVATIKQSNFVNSLSGKVSGLQIRQNNNFGGSTNITIRGNNSLLGNNQPLFIVDGVPVSNYSGNSANQRGGGYGFDYGNAASDINADDIAEINVLKGAAATALYGSRGSNGVVLVTTKKGTIRKGIGVSISNSFLPY